MYKNTLILYVLPRRYKHIIFSNTSFFHIYVRMYVYNIYIYVFRPSHRHRRGAPVVGAMGGWVGWGMCGGVALRGMKALACRGEEEEVEEEEVEEMLQEVGCGGGS
jgi:hypothetical protein